MMHTLTESEVPRCNVGGIRIDRSNMGELGIVFRFSTEDGFILLSANEIAAMIEAKKK
jgi:hypothetical protein